MWHERAFPQMRQPKRVSGALSIRLGARQFMFARDFNAIARKHSANESRIL